MIEQDTIKLLRECDAGIKMGVASIDDVLDHTQSDKLHKKLSDFGHKSEFIKIPDAMHAFVLYDYKYPDEYVTQIMEKIIKCLD